jgi:uncharacterized protein (TIRG00374 family)
MIVKKSLILFLILSVLGIIGVFFYSSDTASLIEVFTRLHVLFLLSCIVGVPLIDWLLSGMRMWLFTRVISPGISFRVCVLNSAVGSFMCAATPSQTGGGAAQIWVLTREGATGGQALTVMLMTFLSTLVFYVFAAVGLWVASAQMELPVVAYKIVFVAAVTLFGSITGGMLLILLRPQYVLSWVERCVERFKQRPWLAHLFERALTWLRESSAAVEQSVRKIKLRFILSVLFSAGIFGNKYFAAYLSAQALGLNPPLADILVIQMFLHILLYFLPTPGGSGGAEIGSAMFMAGVIPEALMPAYTVLWRSAIAYLAVLAGGLIFIHYLHRAGKNFK